MAFGMVYLCKFRGIFLLSGRVLVVLKQGRTAKKASKYTLKEVISKAIKQLLIKD